MESKNIFVFGLDDFHLAQLETLGGLEQYRFHELYQHAEVKPAGDVEFPVADLLEGAREKLDTFQGSVDAIVGFWDFPVSTMLPLLREPYGLASPTFEAVLKCEHKYWSRLEQARCIPGFTPRFCAVDPFADDPAAQVEIDYPFWIKPVKAASSFLGFKVRDGHELDHALEITRHRINRFGNPFNYLLQYAELPPEVALVDGNHCIAEATIAAEHQCTLEGYVHAGKMEVYGIVDSFRSGLQPSSFTRYQYPTTLPESVQQRMVEVAQTFLRHIEYDDSPFNMWRVVSDAIVTRVPNDDEIRRLRERVPDLQLQIHVHEGMRLSELADQDSYTYEIAVLFLGGDSERDLHEKYAFCQESLHLHLHPLT